MQDYQRNQVYNWEQVNVFPKIPSRSNFDQFQTIVDYIWTQLKLINPPKVNIDNRLKIRSTGGRYNINLAPTMIHECVLIHELAHSLNMVENNDQPDMHGPDYVADYVILLTKFYNFDINVLRYTLKHSEVDFNFPRYLERTLSRI